MAQLVRRMHNSARAAHHTGWIDHEEGGRLITPHGFRSSFRKWAIVQIVFPNEMIELALAHQLPDRAALLHSQATNLAELRKLMSMWAKYCAAYIA